MPEAEKKIKEKDVKYETIVMSDLPERPPRGSQIEEKLAEIQGDASLVGKYACIAQYAQPTAATAAANILRKRHGKPEANGWWFGTRKVQVEGEEKERTGLFVSFDPKRIVAGEREKHEAEKAERDKAAKAKAAAKKAAKPADRTPATAGKGR